MTKYTRLVPPQLAEQALAEARRGLQRCNRSEAATLTAELLSCYPDITQARRNAEEEQQFMAYSVKLFEAFEQFSFQISKALVHAGTGLPSRLTYKPKPSDVIAAGAKALQRLQDAVVMAERHIAEARRRAEEDAEQETTPEQRARIAEGFKQLAQRLKTMPEPVPPSANKAGRTFGPEPSTSFIDRDRLIAIANGDTR